MLKTKIVGGHRPPLQCLPLPLEFFTLKRINYLISFFRFPAAALMNNFTETVRNSADIIRVVSDYVSLKGAGSAFKGLCPFHSEKTPSFSVHREKQIFHCFGCGAGGDVFSFVMLAEKVASVRRIFYRPIQG